MGIPGFQRTKGAAWAGDADLSERWSLSWSLETESAIIEASAYGATLEAAAAARLEEMLDGVDGLAELTRILGLALFVGVGSLTDRLLERVEEAVDLEREPGALGTALKRMLGLWRHETVLLAAREEAIGRIVAMCWERALWVFEGLLGPEEPASPGRMACATGLRDGLRYAGADLGLDRRVAWTVMRRRTMDPDAPPDVRGAALGFLWATGAYDDAAQAEAEGISALGQVAAAGDFLVGLFSVAREEVLHAEALIGAIDARVSQMTGHEFMVLLPPMRLAFSTFPPRERSLLAQAIAARHGGGLATAAKLVSRLPATPATLAEAAELEVRIDEVLSGLGLA